ncbi:homeobox protein vex1-like [Bufo gargarizans]|uniref:homeobox protein vex1-like n=1 Tax=Bufo gargarizans TaxID=30331 RepID=UPI001CF34B47|nr:homeobox protein vex1-like [Bufo gargarizans]
MRKVSCTLEEEVEETSDLEMEKRTYTVEWLSVSSHRNMTTTPTTLPTTDLLKCRLGQTFPYGKEHKIPSLPSGTEKLNTESDFSDKENPIDNKIALYQGPSNLQVEYGASISRKAFQEVSANRTCPDQETCQLSDSDSMKSPGSMSEEESTSRPRTKFTADQLQELEKSFKEHRYIGSSEKKRLSKVLKLSETQIKTWFQNRRMKFKRQSQDARVEAFFSGMYLPYYNYSDFQAPSSSVRPDLTIPFTSPALVHPYGARPTAVMRPALHASPITSANFGSYPCPPMLVRPMINEPMSHRYSPY